MCVQEGCLRLPPKYLASHRRAHSPLPPWCVDLLQEVLELLSESGRQAAQRQPSRLVEKIRVRAASAAYASFPSILG